MRTDFTLGADEERGVSTLLATHEREWNFFADDEGLALPESALRKIFRENAVRMLPGIVA